MKITYDKSVDAAYIYLQSKIEKTSKTHPCDPSEVGGMINLDFNKAGVLTGIEVMDASKKLPKEILDSAEIIGN